MNPKQILEKLAQAVVEGDEEEAKIGAREALRAQIDPLAAVEEGLSQGMNVVGRQFESPEVFLPELLMAGEAFNAAKENLNPEMEAKKKVLSKLGTVPIGTMKGDVLNIGKKIVSTVMRINGFKVVDIGVDNSSPEIIEQSRQASADIIALSSLMTTTMSAQREVIQVLRDMNLRDRFLVLEGGGPLTEAWAGEIGANGYGKTAIQAVATARNLVGEA